MNKLRPFLIVVLHLVFWGLLLLVLKEVVVFNITSDVYFIEGKQVVVDNKQTSWGFLLWGLPFKALSVYGLLYWALPRYFHQNSLKTFFLMFVLLTLMPFLLEMGVHYSFVLGYYNYDLELLKLYTFWSIGLYMLLLSFVTGFWFIRQWYRAEKRREVLEKEKLAAELHFLKFQINPHFLFNTLNNLFSMAQASKDEATASGIAKLSGLMRYMLYDSNADHVALAKELAYIEQFMELQQLRIGDDDRTWVSLQMEGDTKGKTIAPMLLIPFVENAFKHGIDPASDSVVQFNVSITDNTLHFSGRNTIHRTTRNVNDTESGIGLENVKKRLALLYPDNHSLEIKEEKDYFIFDLKLALSPELYAV